MIKHMSKFFNFCSFNATSTGAGPFVVASAVDASHATPDGAAAGDGKSYHYFAQSADGTQSEDGFGVYTKATQTLTRVVISSNSDDTTVPIAFTTVPIVDMFPNPSVTLEQGGFPSGTPLLFPGLTTAPLGWTKQTIHNDKALRVVSGTASSGGSTPFSTIFAARSVDAHTLSIAEIPSHTHSYSLYQSFGSFALPFQTAAEGTNGEEYVGATTGSAGGGGGHSHTMDMNVAYVDSIVGTKD
jgi:hypothetical protein